MAAPPRTGRRQRGQPQLPLVLSERLLEGPRSVRRVRASFRQRAPPGRSLLEAAVPRTFRPRSQDVFDGKEREHGTPQPPPIAFIARQSGLGDPGRAAASTRRGAPAQSPVVRDRRGTR